MHTLRAYDTGLQLFESSRSRTIYPIREIIDFTYTKRPRESFSLLHLIVHSHS